MLCLPMTGMAKDAFSEYLKVAEEEARNAVNSYYGEEFGIEAFEPSVAGMFYIESVNKNTGERKKLYLLPDLRNLIEGNLLSRFSNDLNAKNSAANFEQQVINDSHKEAALAPLRKLLNKSNIVTPGTLPTEKNHETGQEKTTFTPYSLTRTQQENQKRDAAFYDQLASLDYIEVTQGDVPIYLFMDPSCPACIQLHQHFNTENVPKEVSLRYVVVAFARDDSQDKAATILQHNSNGQRLDSFNQMVSSKPFTVIARHSLSREQANKGYKAFKKNTLPFLSYYKAATPLLVYELNEIVISEAVTPRSLALHLNRIEASQAKNNIIRIAP